MNNQKPSEIAYQSMKKKKDLANKQFPIYCQISWIGVFKILKRGEDPKIVWDLKLKKKRNKIEFFIIYEENNLKNKSQPVF